MISHSFVGLFTLSLDDVSVCPLLYQHPIFFLYLFYDPLVGAISIRNSNCILIYLFELTAPRPTPVAGKSSSLSCTDGNYAVYPSFSYSILAVFVFQLCVFNIFCSRLRFYDSNLLIPSVFFFFFS